MEKLEKLEVQPLIAKDITAETISAKEIVTDPHPRPVPITETVVTKDGQPNVERQVLPPTTTFEENVNTAGQRRVNLIWEHTQAAIAVSVTVCTMLAGITTLIAQVVYNREVQVPNLIAVAFGTVIGFYFSRTNHQSIGGIGKKDDRQEYKGR